MNRHKTSTKLWAGCCWDWRDEQEQPVLMVSAFLNTQGCTWESWGYSSCLSLLIPAHTHSPSSHPSYKEINSIFNSARLDSSEFKGVSSFQPFPMELAKPLWEIAMEMAVTLCERQCWPVVASVHIACLPEHTDNFRDLAIRRFTDPGKLPGSDMEKFGLGLEETPPPCKLLPGGVTLLEARLVSDVGWGREGRDLCRNQLPLTQSCRLNFWKLPKGLIAVQLPFQWPFQCNWKMLGACSPAPEWIVSPSRLALLTSFPARAQTPGFWSYPWDKTYSRRSSSGCSNGGGVFHFQHWGGQKGGYAREEWLGSTLICLDFLECLHLSLNKSFSK